ncbi:MAG: prepilin-type N-terminal cleavage/methylation domain-containing protein [Anaerococcus sp.]|nr:prepilin-type N-terminal cleavage/methylation domain-containing protein [Anaerococcus sp.]
MKKKGFTLIELVVAIAISSILIAAIGLVLSTNIGISNQAYLSEKSYKQAAYAMTYIEDKINSAYKITEINDRDNCNFYLFKEDSPYEVKDKGSAGPKYKKVYSKYRFYTKNLDHKTILLIETENEYGDETGIGRNRVADLEDISLHYDRENEIINILINQTNKFSRFEGAIRVDKKLVNDE